MVIDIGHIDKRINSTKQTFTKLFQNKTVYLKQPTSVVTPVFILKDTENDNNHKYSEHTNYIYVPEWGYYWIDNIIYRTHDIVEFHCSRDTLATGKDYIKKINSYVKYCSDLNIATEAKTLDDDRLGPDIYMRESHIDLGLNAIFPGHGKSLVKDWFTFQPGEGTILLSTLVMGAGLIHWALTVQQFVDVMMAMAGEAHGSGSIDNFTMQFFGSDWKSCIVQAKFIPIKKDKIDADPLFAYTGQIMAGAIAVTSSSAHGTISPALVKYNNIARTIPIRHTNLPFLNSPKYTNVAIEHFANMSDISSQALVKNDTYIIEESLDILNCVYTQKIYTTTWNSAGTDFEEDTLINTFSDEFGVDLTFALNHTSSVSDQLVGMGVSALKGVISNSLNMASASANAGTTITNGSTVTETLSEKTNTLTRKENNYTTESKGGGSAGSVATSVGTGIIGAFTSFASNQVIIDIQSGNTLSTLKALKPDGTTYRDDLIKLTQTEILPALLVDDQGNIDYTKYDDFCAIHGYPCNKFVTIGDVADDSYIQCVGANAGEVQSTDITYTLTKPELAALNNLLNTGVYLE